MTTLATTEATTFTTDSPTTMSTSQEPTDPFPTVKGLGMANRSLAAIIGGVVAAVLAVVISIVATLLLVGVFFYRKKRGEMDESGSLEDEDRYALISKIAESF